MVAALIKAGPGAVLSHSTAAWWWGLTDREPGTIDVSAPRRARSNAEVRIHQPREIESTRHRRFPITTVARTLLDYATQQPLTDVRRALAETEYKGLLDAEEIRAVIGRGRPGSARLRKALQSHLPELARARSGVEIRFLLLCERENIPLPDVNVRIGWMTVDAVWRKQHLVAELDTFGTHGSPVRMERDRRRELHLRANGFTVVRYTDTQVDEQPNLVAADLRVLLGSAAQSA